MTLPNVNLISFGHFDIDFLSQLADAIRFEFQTRVSIGEHHMDLIEYYDPARRQYNGNKILQQIESYAFDKNEKTIALFNVDLYIPILTFIFGQAYLNGSVAIASMYRLYNQRYGLQPDNELHLLRFKKEVIHELGHTFGLIHCLQPACVMRSSTYVEDIDQKSEKFCTHCKEKLLEA